jgi:hypothetical protein
MIHRSKSRWNPWEYVVPALAITSILISGALVSARHFFWNDELLSYYLLSDPSFLHMLTAFDDKINAAPPLYFIGGWLWAQAFGASEFSLRLFSSLGVCAGLLFVWLTLRRTFGFWPASIGALAMFCTSDLIVSQSAEARMYGLFIGLCALALLLYERTCRVRNVSAGLIIMTVCTHAAIVNTHIFGLIYSPAILFSLILSDLRLGDFRLKTYVSIALSWLAIVPYIPSFLKHADLGRPRSWLPLPELKDLPDFLFLQLNSIVLLVLLLVAGLQFLFTWKTEARLGSVRSDHSDRASESALLIVAYAFLTVPIGVWVISRSVTPIFVDRYMIPSAIGWSIMVAFAASRLLGRSDSDFQHVALRQRMKILFKSSALPFLYVLFLLNWPLTWARDLARGPRRSDPTAHIPGWDDNKFGYTDLPIVVQSSHRFLERLHYSSERERYFFILDWEAAANVASGRFGPEEYKHMEALKRVYPAMFENVVGGEEFLRSFGCFLVLDYKDFDRAAPLHEKGLTKWEAFHCPQWVEMRLLKRPEYRVTELGEVGSGTMLLVERQVEGIYRSDDRPSPIRREQIRDSQGRFLGSYR